MLKINLITAEFIIILRREKQREHARRWRENNPEKAREASRCYRVKNPEYCEKERERAREAARCRYSNNPHEDHEKSRRYRATNPKKFLEQVRRWQANNPEKLKATCHHRRARKVKASGSFTGEQFNVLCALFKHHCLKCGRPRKLTPDHVIPLAWVDRPEFNGVALNNIANIQPLCGSCNSGKNARHVDYRSNPHPNCINPPLVEDYLT